MAEAQRFFAPPPVQVPPAGEQQPPQLPFDTFYPGPDAETRRREAEIFSNVQYILEPQIPKDAPLEFKTQFRMLEWLVSKNMALANIEREDIPHYMDYFSAIVLWLKFRRYDVAARRMIELLMELQLTRSIKFGERIAEISTRQEIVQSQPTDTGKKKGRFWQFWK